MIADARNDVGAALRSFWRWWIAELAAMMPRDTSLGGQDRALVQIWPSASEVRIDRIQSGRGERFVDTQPLDALDDESWRQLAELSAAAHTELILSPPEVFSTSVTLPKAARGHLASAVALQMSDIAPLEPHLLTWATHRPGVVGDTMTVMVTMARTERVTAIQALFEARGLKAPPILGVSGDLTIRLARGSDDGRRKALTRRQRMALICAALIASIPVTIWLGAAVLTNINAQQQEMLELRTAPKLAALRQARQTEKLRQAVAPLAATPVISSMLESLAETAPTSAHARAIEVTSGALSLTFDSSDTAALDRALQTLKAIPGLRKRDEAPVSDSQSRVRYGASLR